MFVESASNRVNRLLAIRLGLTAVALAAAVVASSAVAVASPPPSPTAEPTFDAKPGESVILPYPKIRAWTWLVADLDTGNVLGGRDWNWPLPPASTLKVLAAQALAPRLQLDSTYTATAADADAEGSNVGLEAGSTYTVRDLLKGMLMPSGNDAASAIAGAMGGPDAAVEAMNSEAARLGARNTVAKNTSGLDEPGQTTSAYDLALFLREALKNRELADILALHDTEFPGKAPANPKQERKTYKIWTENRLILNYYPGAIGGKAGFTSQAGRTYVGAAEQDGHRLVVAIMRSAESTERVAMRLLRWAAENFDKLTPVDRLEDPKPRSEPITPEPAASAGAGRTVQSGAVKGGVSPQMFLIFLLVLGGIALVVLRIRSTRSGSKSRSSAKASVGSDRDQRTLDVRDRHDTWTT